MKCSVRSGAHQVGQAGAAAEVVEVGAAAKADVLAMIDNCSRGRIAKRTGAAAELPPGFEEFDVQTPIGQTNRRGQARQTAADNGRTVPCDRAAHS